MGEKENLFKKIFDKPYLKSIVILSGGSLMAQIINFVGSIIVARQYSNITIGYFTYVISVVAMFSTVVNGRYDVSIVSAETEEESFSLIKISFLISIVISLLVTMGTFFAVKIGQSGYANKLGELSFVFPLLLVAGLINILNAYNNRHAEYKLISSAYFVRTTFQNLIFFCGGFIHATSFMLLLGQLVGQFSGIKKQSKRMMADIKKVLTVSQKDMYFAAKKHKDQLIFSIPATFINAMSYSIISLFIGNYFGMALLGLYSYSVRVLGLPLTIFSGNISKVHFKEANEEIKNSSKFHKSTKKMVLVSAIMAVVLVSILMTLSPMLFGIIYGPKWKIAGEYVRILAPMFGFRMIVGSIGFSFIIANKQKVELLFQIAFVIILGILSIIIRLFHLNIMCFLTLLSVLYSLVYIYELIIMIYYSKKHVG